MVEHSKEPGIARLDRFVQYAKEQKVELHPSLRTYHAPGHGLGVHATGVIEVGKIAHDISFRLWPLDVGVCSLLLYPRPDVQPYKATRPIQL
jgi:hypothetical protein